MAVASARFGRPAKRPYWGFCIKMTAVAILGLCFIFVWSMFSSPSNSVTTRIESFDNIEQPPGSSRSKRASISGTQTEKKVEDERKVNGSVTLDVREHKSEKKDAANTMKETVKKKLPQKVSKQKHGSENSEVEDSDEDKEDGDGDEDEVRQVADGKEEALDGEGEANGNTEGEGDLIELLDQESDSEEKLDDDGGESERKGKKRYKNKGPLFDPKAHYHWKSCSTRSKHNYIPCIDIEIGSGRLQQYRHTERSCPRSPPMCLVPLPPDGYNPPVHWPESKEKVYMPVVVMRFLSSVVVH